MCVDNKNISMGTFSEINGYAVASGAFFALHLCETNHSLKFVGDYTQTRDSLAKHQKRRIWQHMRQLHSNNDPLLFSKLFRVVPHSLSLLIDDYTPPALPQHVSNWSMIFTQQQV